MTRRINDEGLALDGTKNISPSFSISDQVNCRWIYINKVGNLVTRCPDSQQAPDDPDLSGRKLSAWVIVATQINKSGFPLKLRVPCPRHPLKILGAVICFYSVNVVDGQPVFVPGHERKCDKPMHKVFFSPTIALCGDDKIAVSPDVGGKNFFWSALDKRLSISDSRGVVSDGLYLAAHSYVKNIFEARYRFPFFHVSPKRGMFYGQT